MSTLVDVPRTFTLNLESFYARFPNESAYHWLERLVRSEGVCANEIRFLLPTVATELVGGDARKLLEMARDRDSRRLVLLPTVATELVGGDAQMLLEMARDRDSRRPVLNLLWNEERGRGASTVAGFTSGYAGVEMTGEVGYAGMIGGMTGEVGYHSTGPLGYTPVCTYTPPPPPTVRREGPTECVACMCLCEEFTESPCGHSALCVACFKAWNKATIYQMPICPLCRRRYVAGPAPVEVEVEVEVEEEASGGGPQPVVT